MNSVVFTDSFPGLAVIFKAFNLEIFDNGQYFGIGLLLGAVALFVGGQRLFAHLGLRFGPALLAAAILGTTPVFWWMQRWYPALSSGVPLLVWAFYFYLDRASSIRVFASRWSVLLVIAVLTHAYLLFAVLAFFAATFTQRVFVSRAERRALVTTFLGINLLNVSVMYIIGYFTVPSKWAQTGGYGWYSANLLSLIDSNSASRWIPDLPSLSGQYEPTALGTGSLLLLVVLMVHRFVTRQTFGLGVLARGHLPLVLVLTILLAISLTNTISIGSFSIKIPIPQRLEHGLSIFRSSARFLWPTLIVLSVMIIASAARRFRFAKLVLMFALLLQVTDYSREIIATSTQPNGPDIAIIYDELLWNSVPASYNKIAAHPAESYGPEWAECAYAAVSALRKGQCGYFSRVQDLKNVNQMQSDALFSGNLDSSTIYWVSAEWLKSHRHRLLAVYRSEDKRVFVSQGNIPKFPAGQIIFANCEVSSQCSFLGVNRQTLGQFLRNS
jgi:hypothetical protein